MILRQDQNGVGRFRHRLGARSDASHHRAAHKVYRILDRHFTCLCHHLVERCTDRYPHRDRFCDFGNHGNVFVCDRFFLLDRTVDIVDRFHIKHSHALLYRQSSGTNYASGGLVDQHHFVSHRVHFFEKMNAHLGKLFDVLSECVHRLHIGFFDTDDRLGSAYRLRDHVEGTHDVIRMPLQKLSVQLEQRFALRTVEENGICLVSKLHVGGKSGSAGTDNAAFLHYFL